MPNGSIQLNFVFIAHLVYFNDLFHQQLHEKAILFPRGLFHPAVYIHCKRLHSQDGVLNIEWIKASCENDRYRRSFRLHCKVPVKCLSRATPFCIRIGVKKQRPNLPLIGTDLL